MFSFLSNSDSDVPCNTVGWLGEQGLHHITCLFSSYSFFLFFIDFYSNYLFLFCLPLVFFYLHVCVRVSDFGVTDC